LGYQRSSVRYVGIILALRLDLFAEGILTLGATTFRFGAFDLVPETTTVLLQAPEEMKGA
jgi:hypothetical protein